MNTSAQESSFSPQHRPICRESTALGWSDKVLTRHMCAPLRVRKRAAQRAPPSETAAGDKIGGLKKDFIVSCRPKRFWGGGAARSGAVSAARPLDVEEQRALICVRRASCSLTSE